MTGFLVSWFLGFLAGFLVASFLDWLLGSSVSWFLGFLVGFLVGFLIPWFRDFLGSKVLAQCILRRREVPQYGVVYLAL